LEKTGIHKCNIFLYADNVEGEAFWKRIGWTKRADLQMMQRPIGRAPQNGGC
jgi:hypothetical protein